MKEIIIDCAGMESPRQLHEAIAREMGFPDWYGHNLDALHDMLTAVTEDTALTFAGFTALGQFRIGFFRVFADCGIRNPNLKIIIL